MRARKSAASASTAMASRRSPARHRWRYSNRCGRTSASDRQVPAAACAVPRTSAPAAGRGPPASPIPRRAAPCAPQSASRGCRRTVSAVSSNPTSRLSTRGCSTSSAAWGSTRPVRISATSCWGSGTSGQREQFHDVPADGVEPPEGTGDQLRHQRVSRRVGVQDLAYRQRVPLQEVRQELDPARYPEQPVRGACQLLVVVLVEGLRRGRSTGAAGRRPRCRVRRRGGTRPRTGRTPAAGPADAGTS